MSQGQGDGRRRPLLWAGWEMGTRQGVARPSGAGPGSLWTDLEFGFHEAGQGAARGRGTQPAHSLAPQAQPPQPVAARLSSPSTTRLIYAGHTGACACGPTRSRPHV